MIKKTIAAGACIAIGMAFISLPASAYCAECDKDKHWDAPWENRGRLLPRSGSKISPPKIEWTNSYYDVEAESESVLGSVLGILAK
jgi:hypothetical protein